MANDIDLMFLAGLFPKCTEEEIRKNSIGSIDNAANVLQWNILNGLDKSLKRPVRILNSLYIGSYPYRYRKLSIKTFKFNHTDGANDVNVGFFNLYGIKQILRFWALKPYLKKWALNTNGNKAIIAYSLTSPFVKSIQYIKKINPAIKTIVVVTDLPQHMDTSNKTSLLRRMLKKYDIKSINKRLAFVDGFVLLTEHMKNELGTESYVVVEGIATDLPCLVNYNTSSEIKTVIYTGTLNEKYGILNLVEAFRNIKNPNYRLILCGSGDSEDKIKSAEISDNRIVYKGALTREEVLELQQSATVLINPRDNCGEYTKYSFPSKNIEYLSTGIPMIGYKLDGIPDEYDKHIFYVEGNTTDALKNKIVEVCEKSSEELLVKGQLAKVFVMDEKNNVVQAKKIIDMIDKLSI